MEREFTQSFVSLLYPTEASRQAHREADARPRISQTVCSELGLDEMCYDSWNWQSNNLNGYK